MARCESAADDAADAAMAKLADRFRTRIDRVKDQISTADARVRELEDTAAAKQQEELLSGAGDLLGAFLGGRKGSNPLGKAANRRAATRKAQARADSATAKLTVKQQELVELEDDLAQALSEVAEEHTAMIDAVETIEIGLEKTDIRVAELKLVWLPVA